jgi:hypothetical protein
MRKVFVATVLMVVAAPAMAKSVEINAAACNADPNMTCQKAFAEISKDLIATIDYKPLGPAEATGIAGFGLGVAVSYVPVDSARWKQVTGSDINGLGMAGVQVTKGLPLNIDVGAFYTQVPSTDIKMYGGEVRYAILPGSTVAPALAVRGSYVTITGVDSFKADTKSLDVSLSKGFAFITPYVGVGYTWGTSDPDASTGLKKVEVNKSKAFVGLRLSMGLFEVTPEVGKLGDNMTYALRAGFSFSL